MAFRIAQPGEKLAMKLPDDTGDKTYSRIFYHRLLASKRKELVKKHGKGFRADLAEWPQEKQEAFLEDVIRECYQGSEGVLGADGAEVHLTVEQILEQPEDFKARLFNQFVTSSTAGVDALGN